MVIACLPAQQGLFSENVSWYSIVYGEIYVDIQLHTYDTYRYI